MARRNALVDELVLVVQHGVRLRDHVAVFFIGREVIDFVADKRHDRHRCHAQLRQLLAAPLRSITVPAGDHVLPLRVCHIFAQRCGPIRRGSSSDSSR